MRASVRACERACMRAGVCACESENKKRENHKEKGRDPARIISVFCKLMEMAAHKSPSPREKLAPVEAPGSICMRLCGCVRMWVGESWRAKSLCKKRTLSGMLWRSDPPFKTDYIRERKSEQPQRGTDGGRYRDLKTEKGNHSLFTLNLLFSSHFLCFASPSLSSTNT